MEFAEVNVEVDGIAFVATGVDYTPDGTLGRPSVEYEDFYLKSDPEKTGLFFITRDAFDEDFEEALLEACQALAGPPEEGNEDEEKDQS